MAQPKKVLIIDDDESIRMFVAAIMEAEGWEVVEALNGQQGLDAAELDAPDLVILDVDMPVMDGFETFKRFRDSPFLGTVPIIMLTGINEERGESYDRERMEQEFGVEGPEDFVDKPVDPVFLLQRVHGGYGVMIRFALVVLKAGGAAERYPITTGGLNLGRGDENQITLHSKQVSRQHARFWMEGDTIWVEDLGSRNGIEINDQRADKAQLVAGDRIVIGGHEIYIEPYSSSQISRSVINSAQAAALEDSIVRDPGDSRLLVLYKAAQLLGELFDLDELLEKILKLIFDALPVERGFVLTISTEDSRPEVRAARSREDSDQGPPLSQTLIRHVFDHGEAILTIDAQADSRFGQAESIMNHDIRAAMCAPLNGRTSVVGVLYVDVGDSSLPLADADLELLTAIARVVGVAVENARLYQENMEKERLAAIGMATAGLGHCVKNILTGIRGGPTS